MMGRPPGVSLFPYTTLFRSAASDQGDRVDIPGLPGGPRKIVWVPVWFERATLTTDRKSIRLNSSHLGISYAVFCLKKKKKKDSVTTICAILDEDKRATRVATRG